MEQKNYLELVKILESLGNKKRAEVSAWFFKTGQGQYGEGDQFLGISVPEQRRVAHRFENLLLSDLKKLLKSKVHEHRFTALEILVFKYEKGSDAERKKIFDFYIKNARRVNNWDLVDSSAPYIAGDYLIEKDKKILYRLAKSENLWERRIAIVSTLAFIKHGKFRDTLKIAEILLDDRHDLIHKAAGWALREVGKKSLKDEIKFLDRYCKIMPRTMLRYAIEKFSERKRWHYLIKN